MQISTDFEVYIYSGYIYNITLHLRHREYHRIGGKKHSKKPEDQENFYEVVFFLGKSKKLYPPYGTLTRPEPKQYN